MNHPATPDRRPETDGTLDPRAAARPMEIREIVSKNPDLASDAQLLALVLATGTGGPQRAKKRGFSSLELADALLEAVGGRLGDLVQAVCADAVEWRDFGIGKNIGARLIAAMELAEGWRTSVGAAFADGVQPLAAKALADEVFARRRRPLAVETVALVLGVTTPDLETASGLLAAFGGTGSLVAGLKLDTFEPAYGRSSLYLRLIGGGVKVKIDVLCRLLATVELARRYGGNEPADTVSLGLASEHLERLLDPATPLDRDLRHGLVKQLRSHPELAGDFATLDRLTGDAGVDDVHRAAEIHRMFKALVRRRSWSDPAEIVGDPVPYRALLRVARASIERAAEPPARLLDVKQRLEDSERRAAARPVATFVAALRGLSLSESGADQALEEARRGYLAGSGEVSASTL